MTQLTTQDRALQIEEPLLFEVGSTEKTGVSLPALSGNTPRLGGLEKKMPLQLEALSEPEAVRHYTRLSQKNYGIDTGIYPLGSCTMKHNPRLNEKMARLDGFADIHPLQPDQTVQGALELIVETGRWLMQLTGMEAVAMSPAAGAHGELCGMMAIRAAHDAKGETRDIVLIPESAHGTNPATAALCGYTIKTIPDGPDGRMNLSAMRSALTGEMKDKIAAVMLTNPNTCGIWEKDLPLLAEIVHAAGAYLYMDGANMNAFMGQVRIGDLGVDAMHINLHKTFSTPHGGGGPGAGPTVLSEALSLYAPLPYMRLQDGMFKTIPHESQLHRSRPFGRMRAFHGQFALLVRAYAYMLMMGKDGLKQASTDAVLNANYLRAALKDDLSVAFDAFCMHEVLCDDRFLEGTGVTTLDFAKAMLDEGVHPMTMYFPLVVHGAMLIEPTETESKASLDSFIAIMKKLAQKAKAGHTTDFTEAPLTTPRRRLNETAAARKPILRYQAPDE